MASPILKWAGGKGRLLAAYEPHFPLRFERYYEPFLGGAAIFFWLAQRGPMSAFLSDANFELICLYQVVQNQLEELIEKLAKLQQQHCEKFYYEQRAKHVRRKVDRAARLLYLNKTCFNGLYRVNSHGQFNVPIGRYKNPAILQEERLRQAHLALQGVDLSCQDFESALKAPQAGDLVYLDPPYEPLTATSSFTSYTSGHFGAEQQKKLAELFRDLVARGCKVILSNSDAPLIRELYAEFPSYEILAPRFINSKKDGRAPIVERLILGNLEEPDAVALGSQLSQSSGDSPPPKHTERSRPKQGRADVVLQN